MRVLLVLPWSDLRAIGGVNTIVHQLTAYLASQGDQVSIATLKWDLSLEKEEFQGTRVFRFPMRSPSSCRTLKSRIGLPLLLSWTLYRLAKLMKQERIEVVNLHYFSDQALYFVLLKRLLRFRFLVSVHGTDVLGKEGPHNVTLINRWIASIDELMVCSEALKNAAFAEGSPAARRACVLRNAVDVGEVDRPLSRFDAVVSVASLIPRKGIDILIRAFCWLTPKFPNWQLWLVGSGELLDELTRLTCDLNCGPQVRFFGALERHQALARVAQARIFCLPSHREGLPLAIAEAMMLKTPVIATRVDGVPEIIRDNIDGILVKPGSVEELSAALEKLMSDENKAAELAASAFTRVQQEFSYDNWGRRYRDLLRGPA